MRLFFVREGVEVGREKGHDGRTEHLYSHQISARCVCERVAITSFFRLRHLFGCVHLKSVNGQQRANFATQAAARAATLSFRTVLVRP